MWQDLHRELVPFLERHLGFPTHAHSGGSASDDDGSRSEGSSLRDKADDLGYWEDQIAEPKLV